MSSNKHKSPSEKVMLFLAKPITIIAGIIITVSWVILQFLFGPLFIEFVFNPSDWVRDAKCGGDYLSCYHLQNSNGTSTDRAFDIWLLKNESDKPANLKIESFIYGTEITNIYTTENIVIPSYDIDPIGSSLLESDNIKLIGRDYGIIIVERFFKDNVHSTLLSEVKRSEFDDRTVPRVQFSENSKPMKKLYVDAYYSRLKTYLTSGAIGAIFILVIIYFVMHSITKTEMKIH